MSLRRHILNRWLKMVERPRMARATTPEPLRRSLELNARFLFHAPRGTQEAWIKLGGVPALEVVPDNLADSGQVIFYVHGGGFTFGSPRTHAAMAAQLAHRLGVRAILPQYRLAPEHPFPAAPDDVMRAWRGLTAQGIAPGDVIIGGDSAGGALAFGLLAQLCDEGTKMPLAAFGFSPLTDLRYSGESFAANAEKDVVLAAERAGDMVQMFLGDQNPEDPRASPLYGDFPGAPPCWITVGDTEILLDDARRLSARLEAQGVETVLEIRHDLPHVWPIMHSLLPEGRETLDELAGWIRRQPGWRGGS